MQLSCLSKYAFITISGERCSPHHGPQFKTFQGSWVSVVQNKDLEFYVDKFSAYCAMSPTSKCKVACYADGISVFVLLYGNFVLFVGTLSSMM